MSTTVMALVVIGATIFLPLLAVFVTAKSMGAPPA